VAWFSFSFCSVKKYGIYILLTISTTHDKIFCLMESLNPDLVDEKELPMGKKIIKKKLQAAKTLYGFMVDHKSVFLQVNMH
jgi:hypothetical protein